MAYQCRARKRVNAVPRGPDGSAFQKCENCGLSIAIALADMHECGGRFKKTGTKKLKAQLGHGDCKGQRIEDQPRSAFRFFVEDFMETCKDGNKVEVENKACEIWKNMSKVERRPFVLQADKLNSAYVKLLQEEENEIQWVDDEADSAEVGKYDKNYETFNVYYDFESSEASGLFPI